jgi:acetoin utilization deacetylase AcuC-like enzyme
VTTPLPLPRPRIGWRERLGRLLDRRRAAVYYSRGYGFVLPSTPADPLRGEKVLTALALRRLLDSRGVRDPAPASLHQLLRVHDADYLDGLPGGEAMLKAFGEDLTAAQRERALATQRAMVGGTVAAAAEAVARGGVAVNVGGGLHHAHRDRAEGFCLFHDVAVAIAELRAGGFDAPVLVVDLDLHDGDGTRSLFAEDPTVYTYSLHNRHWASPDAVANTAIELGSGVDDARLLAVLRETLPAVVAEHRPRLVFYLAGCDPAADDPLGDWRMSPAGMLARDQMVTRLVRPPRAALPLVVLLAGGYGYCAWRYTYRYLAWLLGGGDPPHEPPGDDTVLVARYRALARLLDPAELTGAQGAVTDDWGLSAEELMGSLGAAPSDPRFLGYYTAHGLELALEQVGIFERLRDLGYEQPDLELDLTPGRHTLRVFGDRRRQELLIEVRLHRDRQTLPGFELLALDWLLLQHPRGRFTAQRPALPGQRYPGLGMLQDAVALLVQVCHRLGLDGLIFTPSHYHLVQQSTRYTRMVDPADAAAFEALEEALAGVPLGEASRLVEEGRVVDSRTGAPFVWQGMPMLLALSAGLRERFEDGAWERRRAEARARLSLRLAPAPR